MSSQKTLQCTSCLEHETHTSARSFMGVQLSEYCDDCFTIVDDVLFAHLSNFDEDRLEEAILREENENG